MFSRSTNAATSCIACPHQRYGWNCRAGSTAGLWPASRRRGPLGLVSAMGTDRIGESRDTYQWPGQSARRRRRSSCSSTRVRPSMFDPAERPEALEKLIDGRPRAAHHRGKLALREPQGDPHRAIPASAGRRCRPSRPGSWRGGLAASGRSHRQAAHRPGGARRARIRRQKTAASGRRRKYERKSDRCSTSRSVASAATAVAERGSSSMAANSPKNSPGSNRAMRQLLAVLRAQEQPDRASGDQIQALANIVLMEDGLPGQESAAAECGPRSRRSAARHRSEQRHIAQRPRHALRLAGPCSVVAHHLSAPRGPRQAQPLIAPMPSTGPQGLTLVKPNRFPAIC